MSVYEYIALDDKGRKRKGILDASGIAAARQQLRDEGVYPVDVKPAREKKGQALFALTDISLTKKISAREMSVFTRQLATLLGAGIPLVPSFGILLSQTRNTQLRKMLAQIRGDLNEGRNLTAAMEAFPYVFPPFYINMVKSGEASGSLNLVLERLADFSESQEAIKSKIRSALAYPIIMVTVGFLVIFLLMTFVVPKITQIFDDMQQTLPAITVVLITVSNFLIDYWWLVLLVMALTPIAFRYVISATERGRRAWDWLRLTSPVWGTVNRKIAIARFTRTLATLLQSGVPLLASLEIVRHVVENKTIGDVIAKAAREVEEGQSLSGPLSESGLFPPMVTEMIAVGEQSGSLEKMLNRIATTYEMEAQSDIMVLMSLLEPLLILAMGLMVGFIVLSILLPIFEMNQLIR